MKNIIIGTAGHVDHGKTLLIKALTGIDTDRLKEEKKRGITIELGFAHLDLPNGERAGIIDVPGHEKFIKNMLAGAGGIDLALLIVAADDGVMPQTREHLGILSLLDIHEGLIVITKKDLAEEDWLEMVKEDIRELVQGTFLAEASILPVSAYTGEGIDALLQAIYQLAEKVSSKNTAKPFRIPVDRVFIMDGFGTVITGTLIEGTLNEGDEVEIYPSGVRARARSLQVHAKNVKQAYAGQRVAVNLSGVKKEEVERGGTLAVPGSMRNSMMVDVRLNMLPDSPRVVENGTRLHFYHGARDMLCKLILLEQDALHPGETGYAQLRFTEDVAVKKGDRFVLRFYSPIETVGGGVVLDPNPEKHRRKIKKVLESLRVQEQGSVGDKLLQAIADGSPKFTPLKEIREQLSLDEAVFLAELQKLKEEGQAVSVTDKIAISAAFRDKLKGQAVALLKAYHAENPLQAGMRREDIRSRLLPGRDTATADKLLAILAGDEIGLDEKKAALAGFEVVYGEQEKRLRDILANIYREGWYAPPDVQEVADRYPKEKSFKRVLEAMVEEGLLVAATPQIYFHADAYGAAIGAIKEITEQTKQFTLAEFRDNVGTSRKYALALLDYMDRHGVTKKVGDARILMKK